MNLFLEQIYKQSQLEQAAARLSDVCNVVCRIWRWTLGASFYGMICFKTLTSLTDTGW